jgi:hypothetical protein
MLQTNGFVVKRESENYSPRRHGGYREKKIDNLCELRVSVVKMNLEGLKDAST